MVNNLESSRNDSDGEHCFFFLDNVLVAMVVQLASPRTVLVRQSLIVLRSFLENQKPRTVL